MPFAPILSLLAVRWVQRRQYLTHWTNPCNCLFSIGSCGTKLIWSFEGCLLKRSCEGLLTKTINVFKAMLLLRAFAVEKRRQLSEPVYNHHLLVNKNCDDDYTSMTGVILVLLPVCCKAATKAQMTEYFPLSKYAC